MVMGTVMTLMAVDTPASSNRMPQYHVTIARVTVAQVWKIFPQMANFPFGEDYLGDKDLGRILRRHKKKPPKLYSVANVVSEEDRGGKVWVKVKWAGSWPGQQYSWVPLEENPELEAYLYHYREATALGRGVIQEEVPLQVQYLKTAILSALGKGSHRAGQYTTKASLTIPFPCDEFDKVNTLLSIIDH
uniref:Chromo domain-containing protein n=1 Tax=Branchiostoma floridae TaxID=7739 RepID=C3ZIH8_BRAFL|eukprot:XP_002591692.1 hypothetical protein BRAFLDRAFT_80794 [Branchiostoma floridae]